MIVLSSPTMTLQAVLAAAVAANQPRCKVRYIDMPALVKSDTQVQIPASFPSTLNSTTDVDICEAFGSTRFASGARVIKEVNIYNQDTSSVNVTVKTDDGGTESIEIRATLGTLESLCYEDGRGWYSTDANGAIKTAISQIPMAPLFLAYNSTTDINQTGNGATATVDFDTEVFDVTSNFSADTFTAPISGKYQFNTVVRTSAIPAGSTTFTLRIVTSNNSYTETYIYTAGTFTTFSGAISTIADMDAADTATVTLTISGGAGDTASINGNAAPTLVTYFSGVRVG